MRLLSLAPQKEKIGIHLVKATLSRSMSLAFRKSAQRVIMPKPCCLSRHQKETLDARRRSLYIRLFTCELKEFHGYGICETGRIWVINLLTLRYRIEFQYHIMDIG